MKHQLLSTIAILAAISFGAGCENPAKNSAKAAVGEAQQAAAPSSGKIEKLTLTAGPSTVSFVGSKVTGSHPGSFQQFSGTIDLVDGKAEGGAVTVDIDMASVKTEIEKLDGHLKSPDFFDVAKYPKAQFVSTSVKLGGDKGASHTLTGNLSLHGVTKSISFPATISVGADAVTATSEFSISRKDFSIVYPGMPNDLIRDDVLIKLSLKVARTK
jgi:polyisoprenoid-binding protein YceI